ncbi:MAG TPA: LptF/LptG family permease [Gemmatimonadales bacterium]
MRTHPFRLLDAYVSREFLRIFVITLLGFPIFTVLIQLTDNIDRYLSRNIPPKAIAEAYAFTMVEQIFFIIPAAVLFATVFSTGALSRHSEITAAKASGISFQRMIAPVFALAALAAVFAFTVGEWVPFANQRRSELLGEREIHSQTTRTNFIYRADGGRTYAIGELIAPQKRMRDVQIERQGTGPEFPGYFLNANSAVYTTKGWTLLNGALRLFMGPDREIAFTFNSMRQRALNERPEDLLSEPKAPDQMNYNELGHYVQTLERSGSDANKLKVERALKIAIPVTCIVIALFGAPLGATGSRSGPAYGVAVSLATTVVFLMSVQIARAVGSGGVLPPLVAAWIPNAGFGLAGIVLMSRART